MAAGPKTIATSMLERDIPTIKSAQETIKNRIEAIKFALGYAPGADYFPEGIWEQLNDKCDEITDALNMFDELEGILDRAARTSLEGTAEQVRNKLYGAKS